MRRNGHGYSRLLLLRAHRGPSLSRRKNAPSGKFSNAITPPPCVCLDKGIMRFYASHACFVDLQRCLCTRQGTPRACLAALLPFHLPFPSAGNESGYSRQYTDLLLVPRVTPNVAIHFSRFYLPFENPTTLVQSVIETSGTLLSQKVHITVFLTLNETQPWDPRENLFSGVEKYLSSTMARTGALEE